MADMPATGPAANAGQTTNTPVTPDPNANTDANIFGVNGTAQTSDQAQAKLLDNGNVWEDKPEENAGDQPAQITTTAAADATPKPTFAEYVSQLNFDADPNVAQSLVSAMNDGNMEDVSKIFQKFGQQIYTKAVEDASRMLDTHGRRIETDLLKKVDGKFSTRDMRGSLEEAVVIAKNPNIAPIAEALKTTFMRQGKSDEQANTQVQRFLLEMSGMVQETLGSPPANRPGDGSNASTEASEPNWAEILSIPD